MGFRAKRLKRDAGTKRFSVLQRRYLQEGGHPPRQGRHRTRPQDPEPPCQSLSKSLNRARLIGHRVGGWLPSYTGSQGQPYVTPASLDRNLGHYSRLWINVFTQESMEMSHTIFKRALVGTGFVFAVPV